MPDFFVPPLDRVPAVLRRLCAALCLLGAACAATAQQQPVPWPASPYSHFAQNVSLQSVLEDFARSFSLELKVAGGVRETTVNGRLTSATPTEFLNRLASMYGFDWYVYSGVLHVSDANAVVVRNISAPGRSVENLRQALTDVGVFRSRFGWGELTGQDVALVSGPLSYVNLVESIVRGLPQPGGAQQVAVFRLRHATAEDRTILYRDREITTPGLASILQDLISGGGGALGTANNEALSAIAAPLRSATPLGKGEEDNQIVEQWGEKPAYDFTPIPHWDLGDRKSVV